MKGVKVKGLAGGQGRADERAAVVKSLAGLRVLISKDGNKEEVEVVIGKTLAKLSEVKPIRKLLHKKMERKHWCVRGISKLQPFVNLATQVYKALASTNMLIRLIDPDTDLSKHAVAAADLENLIREEAKKLRKTGRRLESIKYLPAVNLGKEVKDVGKDLLRKYRTAPAALLSDLCRLRMYGRDAYNQKVDVESMRI